MISSLPEDFANLNRAVVNETLANDIQKAIKGEVAAGRRVRKTMQNVKELAQAVRNAVLVSRGDGDGESDDKDDKDGD